MEIFKYIKEIFLKIYIISVNNTRIEFITSSKILSEKEKNNTQDRKQLKPLCCDNVLLHILTQIILSLSLCAYLTKMDFLLDNSSVNTKYKYIATSNRVSDSKYPYTRLLLFYEAFLSLFHSQRSFFICSK